MNTAGVPTLGKLAAWSSRAGRVNELIQQARYFLASGKSSPDPVLLEAQQLAAQHRTELATAAGVFVPSSSFAPIPLDALSTPDAHELLTLLERAQSVAERVDAARGRVLPADLPLQPGESRGTDLAESISELCLRLRQEVEGPQGRD